MITFERTKSASALLCDHQSKRGKQLCNTCSVTTWSLTFGRIPVVKTITPSRTTANLFFEGNVIYSYGHHFPIAKIYERNGHKAVLFTTEDYSVTTQAHKSRAWFACHHMNPFRVPIVRNSWGHADLDMHRWNLESYQRRIIDLAGKAERVNVYSHRGPMPYLEDIEKLTLESGRYRQFFSTDLEPYPDVARMRIGIEPDHKARILARWERLNSPEAEAKRERNRAKREEREARQHASLAERWRNYEPIGYSQGRPLMRLPCMLRVVWYDGQKVMGEIQTSHGARFPHRRCQASLSLDPGNPSPWPGMAPQWRAYPARAFPSR